MKERREIMRHLPGARTIRATEEVCNAQRVELPRIVLPSASVIALRPLVGVGLETLWDTVVWR
jgi:hypothetical protein